jgi:ribose 5-phosphate isomerase A
LSENSRSYKRQAAARALELVEPGMILGLGTGSTAAEFITLLAEREQREKLGLRCIATSEQTREQAERAGIKIVDFGGIAHVDLTVDGADEIGPDLSLIKGGGGALLHEKIVAMASERVCIIAEHAKLVDKLGAFTLPVEIVEFGLAATLAMIEAAAAEAGCRGKVGLRRGADGKLFRTDEGNLIADCAFGEIRDPAFLADALGIVPGVVEHGLFIGIADEAILAGPGGLTILRVDDSQV